MVSSTENSALAQPQSLDSQFVRGGIRGGSASAVGGDECAAALGLIPRVDSVSLASSLGWWVKAVLWAGLSVRVDRLAPRLDQIGPIQRLRDAAFLLGALPVTSFIRHRPMFRPAI